MNHSRHHAREVALQILFALDTEDLGLDSSDLTELLNNHFEHFQIPEGVRGFSAQLVAGAYLKRTELDLEIEKFANHWRVERMATIDRNLLRMAIYEMTEMKNVPPMVTIDEAIELAKQFGSAETGSFVNAILDSIRKDRKISA